MATLNELRTAVETLRKNCAEHAPYCKDCIFKTDANGECELYRAPEYWADPAQKKYFTDADKAAAKMCEKLDYDTIKIEHKNGVRTSTALAWNSTKTAFVLPSELFPNFDVDITLSIKTILEKDYAPVTYLDLLRQNALE